MWDFLNQNKKLQDKKRSKVHYISLRMLNALRINKCTNYNLINLINIQDKNDESRTLGAGQVSLCVCSYRHNSSSDCWFCAHLLAKPIHQTQLQQHSHTKAPEKKTRSKKKQKQPTLIHIPWYMYTHAVCVWKRYIDIDRR